MTETKFTKPKFTKPGLPVVEMGGKSVNLSDEAKSEDVETWVGVLRVKLFKAFYDSLVKSMKSIVTL